PFPARCRRVVAAQPLTWPTGSKPKREARRPLVHELEERSAGETASRIAALRKGTKPKDLMLSRNASGLAEDYSNLTREILVRMSTITAERASA
ncbi:hypothetical protein ABZ575_39845, partial [Streptomyces sp. NPDC018347]